MKMPTIKRTTPNGTIVGTWGGEGGSSGILLSDPTIRHSVFSPSHDKMIELLTADLFEKRHRIRITWL